MERGLNFKPEAREEKNHIKEEWFKAFYRGIATTPQILLGANLYTTQTSLSLDKKDWQNFFTRRLSESQIQALGERMNNMHESRGIDFNMAKPNESQTPFLDSNRKYFKRRFQELWNNTKLSTGLLIAKFIVPHPVAELIDNSFFEECLDNPEYADRITDLRNLVNKTIEIVEKDSETRALLSRYREEFDKKNIPTGYTHRDNPRRPIWENYYRKDFKVILEDRLKKEFQPNEKISGSTETFLQILFPKLVTGKRLE